MVIATEVWPDGSSYEGSWFQGALHGQGRFDSRFDGGRYMQGGPAMGVGSVPVCPRFFSTVVWKRSMKLCKHQQPMYIYVWHYEILWVVGDSICIIWPDEGQDCQFAFPFFASNPTYRIHPHTLLFKVMLKKSAVIISHPGHYPGYFRFVTLHSSNFEVQTFQSSLCKL